MLNYQRVIIEHASENPQIILRIDLRKPKRLLQSWESRGTCPRFWDRTRELLLKLSREDPVLRDGCVLKKNGPRRDKGNEGMVIVIAHCLKDARCTCIILGEILFGQVHDSAAEHHVNHVTGWPCSDQHDQSK